MSLIDSPTPNAALTHPLTTKPPTQLDLLNKHRDIIVQYLILDIEDYLAEARERTQAADDALGLDEKRSTLSKLSHLHLGLYDSIPLHHLLHYQLRSLWEQWATNPYGLHPAWYFSIMLLLWLWLIGNIVCGYYETAPESGSVRVAKLCRTVLGSIPPTVQFLLFLFPPLFVQF